MPVSFYRDGINCSFFFSRFTAIIRQALVGRLDTDRDSLAAVLHVDPVVAVVPDALDAQVVTGVQRVWQAGQRLDEETLNDIASAGQHQHPRVDAQTVQAVYLR